MELSSPNEPITKSIVSEDPQVLEDKQKIKPIIYLMISNCCRKKGPTIFGYIRSKDPRFTKHATHIPNSNRLNYSVGKVKTLQKAMHSLNKNFKHLRSLQHFSLHIGKNNQKLTDADLYYVSRALKRPVSLQILSFGQFGSYSEITDRGLYCLGKVLKRMYTLKRFEFPFGFNKQIADQSLVHFSRSLKRLTSLERLTLDLRICSNLTDFGVSALNASLNNLIFLRHLAISFSPSNKITEKGILNLYDSFHRFPCLRNLSLNLPGAHMTKAGFKRVGEMLKKLVPLQSLTITNYGTDLGLYELSNGLKELVSLQYLKIHDSALTVISNNGLFYFSEALKGLVGLKSLEIRLGSSHNTFDDRGLSHLGKGLERLKLLENLSLTFWCANRISDKGLNALSKGLEKLTLLQEIVVSFAFNENITNEGARDLCKVFKKFQKLRGFGFLTERCPNFTSNGCYMICQVLKDVPSLEVLSFEMCYINGKEKILEALKSPKLYFRDYHEGLELLNVKKNKRNWLNKLFVMFSVSVIFIGILVRWLLHSEGK